MNLLAAALTVMQFALAFLSRSGIENVSLRLNASADNLMAFLVLESALGWAFGSSAAWLISKRGDDVVRSLFFLLMISVVSAWVTVFNAGQFLYPETMPWSYADIVQYVFAYVVSCIVTSVMLVYHVSRSEVDDFVAQKLEKSALVVHVFFFAAMLSTSAIWQIGLFGGIAVVATSAITLWILDELVE